MRKSALMKICLINPPSRNSGFNNFKYDPYNQPVQSPGLAYIAAVLEKSGFNVDVLECYAASISLNSLYAKIEEEQYGMIGISAFYYNFINVARIANKIKEILPSAFVFAGGFYATLNTEDLFHSIENLDCCVLGEGEYICLDLAQAVMQQGDIRKISGIAYKENEKIIYTGCRPFINSLDALPTPKVTFISEHKMAGISTSRGCYGNCSFCASDTYSRLFPGIKVRMRSPESIIKEVDYLVLIHGVKSLVFFDDNFLFPSPKHMKRMEQFCNLLMERNYKIRFQITARVNKIEQFRVILLKMKEAGLDVIFLGIESFVQRQLDFYNKKVTVEQNVRAMEFLNEIGISYSIGLIMLEPFTTIEEILTNIRMLKMLNYAKVRHIGNLPISVIQPLQAVSGSKIYEDLSQNQILVNSELGYEFTDPEVSMYWKAVKQWRQKIYDTALLYDVIYEAEYHGNMELYEFLFNEKVKLMELDLNFLENLCIQIKRASGKLDYQKELTGEWEEKLGAIHKKFVQARELLDLQ